MFLNYFSMQIFNKNGKTYLFWDIFSLSAKEAAIDT